MSASANFTRLMASITTWVAPRQGCAYCHDVNNMASDALYTKVVARRMIQMVQHINSDWKSHVAETGVTCYTCHRGNPVPPNIWFTDPGPDRHAGYAQTAVGKNHPADRGRHHLAAARSVHAVPAGRPEHPCSACGSSAGYGQQFHQADRVDLLR